MRSTSEIRAPEGAFPGEPLELTQALLGDHVPELVSAAEGAGGLERDEAERLVPVASRDVLGVVLACVRADGRLPGAPDVLERLDLSSLARRTALDVRPMSAGLERLVPRILDLVRAQGEGLPDERRFADRLIERLFGEG